jgi:hypothetical protein
MLVEGKRDRSGETPPLRPAAARKRLRRTDAASPRTDTTAKAVAYKRARPLKRPDESVTRCMRRSTNEAAEPATLVARVALVACKGDRFGETPPLRPAAARKRLRRMLYRGCRSLRELHAPATGLHTFGVHERPLRRDASASACPPRQQGSGVAACFPGVRRCAATPGNRHARRWRARRIRSGETPPLRPAAARKRLRRTDAASPRTDTTANAVAYKRARPLKRPDESVTRCMRRSTNEAAEPATLVARVALVACKGDRSGETPPLRPAPHGSKAAASPRRNRGCRSLHPTLLACTPSVCKGKVSKWRGA